MKPEGQKAPVKGAAHAEEALMAEQKVLEGTDETFEQEVLKAVGPVLVYFWAPGCPPCAAMDPILQKVASETEGVKFVRINAAKEHKTAARYRVQAVPTLAIFKEGAMDGQPVIGFRSEGDLRQMVAGLVTPK